MKYETPHQGELERGLSGLFGCLDCTLFPAFAQAHFPVLSQILPVLPGVVAVCREVAV